MSSRITDEFLERFQASGSTHSLLEYVRASKLDEPKYQNAIEVLAPVFEGLQFGERPQYYSLNIDALRQQREEVENVVRWMAGSNKADVKSAAIELMGILGWESFFPDLEQSVASAATWERIVAITALGQMSSIQAAEVLESATKDPDPQVSQAAHRALSWSREKGTDSPEVGPESVQSKQPLPVDLEKHNA